MTAVLRPDICVIGAGSAGLSVAAGAAQMGADVVLVERGEMGGDCLNTGCVPSKSLIAAASRAAAGGHKALGVALAAPEIDFGAVQDHVRQVIAGIAPHDSQARFEGLGVTVLRETACFTGPREVAAGERRIRAKRFVIAAGSRPAVPPIAGLESVPYLTNETIFDIDACPEHLIVIGGGPIGVELAQAHRRLGAAVTVIEMAQFLPRDDCDAAGIVTDQLTADGVTLLAGAKTEKVDHRNGEVAVTLNQAGETQTIKGSHLLIATGRRPNMEDLNLDAAGIEAAKTGITVDARLRTTNKRIFAVGDVTGRHQFTHMAGYDAGIVIRNTLFRLPAKAQGDIVPWVTYTDPELAQVGLTEEAAKAKHGDNLRVLRHDFADIDRARCEGDTRGFLKVIADRRGRILGATCVGAESGELIQPWILAMHMGRRLKDMAGMIAPYPTRGEVAKITAGQFYEPVLFGPRVRTLVRLLLKLP